MLANVKFLNKAYSPETFRSYLNSEEIQAEIFNDMSKDIFSERHGPLQFNEVQLIIHIHREFSELIVQNVFSDDEIIYEGQLNIFLGDYDLNLNSLFQLLNAIKYPWVKLSYSKLNEIFTDAYFQVFIHNVLNDVFQKIELLLVKSVKEIDLNAIPLNLIDFLVSHHGDYDGGSLKKIEVLANEGFSSNIKFKISLNSGLLTEPNDGSLQVPITYQGNRYGVLNALIESQIEDTASVSTCNSLANILAYFIHFQTIHESDIDLSSINIKYHQSLEKALVNIVDVTSKVLELRDAYTAGHQNSVTEICCEIGKKMSLSQSQLTGLNLAARVHDIGKIAIPSDILTKPSRLNVQEFELVKTHSQIGYQLLCPYDFPWPLAEIVYQHHERLNGKGYPRGLVENEILLEAKILSVADAFESIMAHRPYRPAQGIEVARKALINDEHEYDQNIVKICFELYESGHLSNASGR